MNDEMNGVVSIEPFGDAALLVTLGSLSDVHALDSAITAAMWSDVVECVPAYRTVLVRVGMGVDQAELSSRIWALDAPCRVAPDRQLFEIPVVYDGVDLDDVAHFVGVPVREVVSRHTAPEYTVAFLGFLPGFAYLAGLDPTLAVPRLATPRVVVPTQSVAIGGDQTAVYPAESPGGWRLIGTTVTPMWDPVRALPLLSAGDRVRFVDVTPR